MPTIAVSGLVARMRRRGALPHIDGGHTKCILGSGPTSVSGPMVLSPLNVNSRAQVNAMAGAPPAESTANIRLPGTPANSVSLPLSVCTPRWYGA